MQEFNKLFVCIQFSILVILTAAVLWHLIHIFVNFAIDFEYKNVIFTGTAKCVKWECNHCQNLVHIIFCNRFPFDNLAPVLRKLSYIILCFATTEEPHTLIKLYKS